MYCFCYCIQFLSIKIYRRLEQVNVFPQFEEALMTDTKILNLDEPMTLEDCAFLGSVYLPCEKDSTEVDLTSLSTAEIQDFAIVFKILDGKTINTISFPLLSKPLTFFASFMIKSSSTILGMLVKILTISTRHVTGKFSYYIQY